MPDDFNNPLQPTPPKRSVGRRLLVLLPTIGFIVALVVIAVLATKLSSATSNDDSRTISVSGTATLKEEPDEYVFYPNYGFKNDNKDAALAEMSKKSDAVTAGLKQLGVADKAIKTNSNGYDGPIYYDQAEKQASYNLQMTVTVNDKAMAQKVQDYLLTTTPTGAVSPQAQFSDVKRKSLESKARDQATAEARSKADQSAKNLGFKIGKVKSVDDGGFGGVAYATEGSNISSSLMSGDAAKPAPAMAVSPGQNELSYSVNVVYQIR